MQLKPMIVLVHFRRYEAVCVHERRAETTQLRDKLAAALERLAG